MAADDGSTPPEVLRLRKRSVWGGEEEVCAECAALLDLRTPHYELEVSPDDSDAESQRVLFCDRRCVTDWAEAKGAALPAAEFTDSHTAAAERGP